MRLIGFMLMLPLTVSAATFTVNYNLDLPSSNPGDGVCAAIGFPPTPPHTIAPGHCTLRAAVEEANALAGSHTIVVPGGATYILGSPYTGLGSIEVDADVLIWQQLFDLSTRPVIFANGRPGAFAIQGGDVSLSFLDITGGAATDPGDSSGGGISVAFGAGTVNLFGLRIHGNSAGSGGGLYNDGPDTTLSFSEVFNNTRVDGFGGANSGAGIFNRGTLRIENSAVFDNHGSAAIDTRPPFTGEPLLMITNSTIADNDGPGVLQVDEGLLVVRNSTVSRNTTGVILSGAGGTGGELQLRVSAIAGNHQQDCALSVGATLSVNRYNLDSDDTCELASGTTNQAGVDAMLAPLMRHPGEFTHSMRPMPGSPLIDQGHPTIGAIGCADEDQRGVTRPIDYTGDDIERCDIGAIELQQGEDASLIFHDRFEQGP